jgi:signal transduction histidine kinase
MENKNRLLLLFLILLVPLSVGTIIYRTNTTLNNLNHTEERKAYSIAETMVKAIKGIVKYGRDKKERVKNVLKEIERGNDFISVSIALNPGQGDFIISNSPDNFSAKTVFNEIEYRVKGKSIILNMPFSLKGKSMGRGCRRRRGQRRDSRDSNEEECVGWGGMGPGNYIIQLHLKSANISIIKNHVLFEAVFLIILLLTSGGLMVLLIWIKGKKERAEYQYALSNQRNETLENLQFISSGLAHETKNPLGSIRGYTQMINERTDNEKTKEETEIILSEIDRVTSRLNEFLRFTGKKQPKLENFDLGIMVKEVITLFAPDFTAKNIEVACKSCGNKVISKIDPVQIKELLINIMLNAIDACSEGDTILVETTKTGSQSAIIVQDSGKGISPEGIDKVFNPYYTTKQDGTGLGLAICKRIAEDHNAQFFLTSEEGDGTRVEIRFER